MVSGNVSDLVITTFLEINNLYNATGQKLGNVSDLVMLLFSASNTLKINKKL